MGSTSSERAMPETRTIERTETKVKTTETTEYQCANCPNWYTKDELVKVEFPNGEDKICCAYCAESVFDYTGPVGLESSISAEKVESAKSFYESLYPIVAGSVVALVTIILPMYVIYKGMELVTSSIPENPDPFAQAARDVSSTEPLSLIGMMLLIVIATVVVSYLTGGPTAFKT